MNPTSNEQLQAIINELEVHNLPYKIEQGSKHCMVRYEVNGTPCVASVSRGHHKNWRGVVMKRADIRRAVRTYGQKPTETATGEFDMSTLKVITDKNLELVRGEPRMRDVDIAEALGFSRSQNVRTLIASHEKELRSYGALALSERPMTERGGRPGKMFLLNKDQSLLIAMVSRAPGAVAVRQQVIQAYNDWNTNHTKDIEPMIETSTIPVPMEKSAEPELLLNKDAVSAITEAVAIRMSQQPSISGGITKSDLQDVMGGLLEYQNRQFEALLGRISGTPLLAAPVADDSTKVLTLSLTEALKGFQSSFQSIDQRLSLLSGDKTDTAQITPKEKAEVIKEVPPPKDGKKPKDEPVQEDDELLDISGLYKMLGINPNRLPNRLSMSQKIRNSMHMYATKKRVELMLHTNKYGIASVMYPKSLASDWYTSQGKALIRKTIIKQTSGMLA